MGAVAVTTPSFWTRKFVAGVFPNFTADVLTLSPDRAPTEHLAFAVRSSGLLAALRSAIRQRPGIRAVPFALDRPTLRLFEELGVHVLGYGAPPGLARRCLERMDAEGITGMVRVVDALSETDNVYTQGPVWRVAGRSV